MAITLIKNEKRRSKVFWDPEEEQQRKEKRKEKGERGKERIKLLSDPTQILASHLLVFGLEQVT